MGTGQRHPTKATWRKESGQDKEHLVERTVVHPSLASPGVLCLCCCARGRGVRVESLVSEARRGGEEV